MKYNNIRSIRENKGLSQQAVADLLKITRQQYHLYESGKRELPAHLLKELTKIFNVTSDYILDIEYDDMEFNFKECISNISDDFMYLYNLLDTNEHKENEEIYRAINRVKNRLKCTEIEIGYIRSKYSRS